MEDSVYASLYFAHEKLGDLNTDLLKALYAISLEHEIFSPEQCSLDDFFSAYESSAYDVVPKIALLQLSSSFKLSVMRLSTGPRNTIQTAEELDLPALDTKESSPAEPVTAPKSPKKLNAKERIEENRAFLQKDASKFSKLSDTIGDLRNKLSQLHKNTDKMRVSEESDSEKPAESNEVQFTEQQPTASVVQGTDHSSELQHEYDALKLALDKKLHQLHEVRRQVHEEKQELYLVRKLISESITSIEDTRIAHILQHLKHKKQELEQSEKLLYSQQHLFEEQFAEKQNELQELNLKHRSLLHEIKNLEIQKSQDEQDLQRARGQLQQVEGQVYQNQQRFGVVSRQIDEAQRVYDELQNQAQKTHDDLKSGREALEMWESELQEREEQLVADEKEARVRLQSEREDMRQEVKDVEKTYREKLRMLEKKELILDSQQSELIVTKEELYAVKKQLEQDRQDLHMREKEFNQQHMTLQAKEKQYGQREI